MSEEKKHLQSNSEKATRKRRVAEGFRLFFLRISRFFTDRRKKSKNVDDRICSQSLDLSRTSSIASDTNISPQICSSSTGQLRSEQSAQVSVHVDVASSPTPQNFKDVLNAKLGANPHAPGVRRKPPGVSQSQSVVNTSPETAVGSSTLSTPGDTSGSSPAEPPDTSPSVNSAPAGADDLSLPITDLLVNHRVAVNQRRRRPPSRVRASAESIIELTDFFSPISPVTPALRLNRINEDGDQESVGGSATAPVNASSTDTADDDDPGSRKRSSLKLLTSDLSSSKCALSSEGGGSSPAAAPVPPEQTETPEDVPAIESPSSVATANHHRLPDTPPVTADDQQSPTAPTPSSGDQPTKHSAKTQPSPLAKSEPKPRLRRVHNREREAPGPRTTTLPLQGAGADPGGHDEEKEDISMSSVAKRASVFGVVIHPVNRTANGGDRPSRTRSSSDQNGIDSVRFHRDSEAKETPVDQEKLASTTSTIAEQPQLQGVQLGQILPAHVTLPVSKHQPPPQ